MFSMNISVALESYFLKKRRDIRKNLLRTLAKKKKIKGQDCLAHAFLVVNKEQFVKTHICIEEKCNRRKVSWHPSSIIFLFPRFPAITHVLILITPEWEHLWRYCICFIILELYWTCCVVFSELWVKRKVKPDKFSLHQHIIFFLHCIAV